MNIYIAERGLYDERGIAGLFDGPERAMAHFTEPNQHWTKTTWTYYPSWPDTSVITHRVSWTNGLDWGEHIEITAHELTNEGPTREADEKVVQTLRESDGGWDYLPEQKE